jgi:hypothetical protein
MNIESIQKITENLQRVDKLISEIGPSIKQEQQIYRKRTLIQRLSSEIDKEIAAIELRKLQSGGTPTLRKRLRKLYEKKTILTNLLT